jgi:hypothetical protein
MCRKNALRCRKNALNETVRPAQVGVGDSPDHSTTNGGNMSRRIRFALALVLVSFALSAAACADASGPSSNVCDNNNPVTCH